jgi:hypothetical protein
MMSMTTRKNGISPAMILLVVLTVMVGCRSGEEPEPQVEIEPEEEVVEEDDEDARHREEVSELYGLPMPPDYFHVQRQNYRIRVSTDLDVEEVAEFFEDHAVDAEVFRSGGRIEVLPLRSQSGRATAYNYGGRNGYTVIDYRRPPDRARAQAQEPEQEQERSAEEIRVASMTREDAEPVPITQPQLPVWVAQKKGEPVEARDDQGNLIAPGARWGEPYIPPEGSPLHNERYRHLWGRPYGAW